MIIRAYGLVEEIIPNQSGGPTMLVRLVRGSVKPRSTSWHMLAGYGACKAWRDFEFIEDRAEVGREEGKSLLIFLNTINKSISTHQDY